MVHAAVVKRGGRRKGKGAGTKGVDLSAFSDVGLTARVLDELLAEHDRCVTPRCDRLWGYYRNEERVRVDAHGNVVREAWQAQGLPARLRSRREDGDDRADRPRAVIENDIAWRVDALIDMAFGQAPEVLPDAGAAAEGGDAEGRGGLAARAVAASLEASGGEVFVRDLALLGAVHGWVDLVVRTDALFERVAGLSDDELRRGGEELVLEMARLVRIEVVEPSRGVALVSPEDYRELDAYMIRTRVKTPGGEGEREVLEVLSDARRRVYVDGEVRTDAPNRLGVMPVVHVQHASVPFAYAGLSEVEPLIGLQDELNTRLSDRAHRVTLQSFNMYLAKGLDGVSELAVGPGKVWLTDNPDASVHAFGGDGHSPSEEAHIDELREALDKASAVSPVVLGVVRAKLGHLSSVNALRMTLLGVLTKTAQRRRTYGRGLERCAAIVLSALDSVGVLATSAAQRRVTFAWPDPLPTTEEERLRSARSKLELGASADAVLGSLGLTPEGDGDEIEVDNGRSL